MEYKLSDAELEIMNLLWDNVSMQASDITAITKQKIGWERNTTYTLLQRLIKKGAITRTDPNFICAAVAKRDKIRQTETKGLLDKLYGGSMKLFIKSFIKEQKLSKEEIAELKKLIDEME